MMIPCDVATGPAASKLGAVEVGVEVAAAAGPHTVSAARTTAAGAASKARTRRGEAKRGRQTSVCMGSPFVADDTTCHAV